MVRKNWTVFPAFLSVVSGYAACWMSGFSLENTSGAVVKFLFRPYLVEIVQDMHAG